MAKGIIAGTGTVTFINPADNSIMCTSKTLIDSGISMAINNEEARGGSGNMLLGKYFHDSSFGLTLTDQIWDLQYIAMNCGGTVTSESDVFKTEQYTMTSDGYIRTTNSAKPFGGELIGWYKLATESDDSFRKFTFDSNDDKKSASTISVSSGTNICVKYLYRDASARQFIVSADYVPSVVHAILTINLFKAGVTQETLTSSSKIGEIVINVPNFQLEGSQDLSLSASGIASVALSGNALATFDGLATCDGRGYYAIITEVIYDKNEWDNVIALAVANSNIDWTAGQSAETIKVYKMYSDGTQPTLVDNSKLTFTGSDGITVGQHTGVISNATKDGTVEITVTEVGIGLTAGVVIDVQ